MPELYNIVLGQAERPNVTVYGGLNLHREKLVVFVDRFEGLAFHSEPGLPKYEGAATVVAVGMYCVRRSAFGQAASTRTMWYPVAPSGRGS